MLPPRGTIIVDPQRVAIALRSPLDGIAGKVSLRRSLKMSPLSVAELDCVPPVASAPATGAPGNAGDEHGIPAGMYFARMKNGETHFAETADRLYELIEESGATVQDVLVIGDTNAVAFPSVS